MSPSVTLVGAGLMGRALGSTWLAAGLSVFVWNRTPEHCQPIVDRGAVLTSSLAEAVVPTDLTVVVLANTDVAVDVLRRELGSLELAGRVVVNLSTGTPSAAGRLADVVAERGGLTLEGVISGYPSDIGSSRAMVQCSGDPVAWARVKESLTVLAPAATTYVGAEVGLASIVDVIQTGYVYTNAISGFLEAAALARTQGLTIDSLLPGVDLMLDLLRMSIREAAQQIDSGAFSAADATVDIYLAAIRQWRETTEQSGVWPSHLDAIIAHLERAQASGLGTQGFFSEVTSMARPQAQS